MRHHAIKIWYGFSGTITTVVAALLLATAYGGHVDPHSHALPSIIALAYPLLLFIALGMTVLWIVLHHLRLALFMAVTIALTWPTARVTTPLHFGSATVPDSAVLRVLTFNVHNFGYGHESTDSASLRYILDSGADVVLLQEASTDYDYEHDLPLLRPLLGELEQKYPYHSHGHHDVSILSRYPYDVVPDTLMRQVAEDNRDSYHVYAKAFDVHIPGRQLRVVSAHLQSIGLTDDDKRTYINITRLDSVSSREQLSHVRHSIYDKLAGAYRRRAVEAQVLRSFIDDCPANVIVCGDFNDTPASFSYLTVRGSDLRDAYADAALGPTHTYNRNRFYFRIDHILYRGDLQAVSTRCDHAGNSDHYPLVATFRWTQP